MGRGKNEEMSAEAEAAAKKEHDHPTYWNSVKERVKNIGGNLVGSGAKKAEAQSNRISKAIKEQTGD